MASSGLDNAALLLEACKSGSESHVQVALRGVKDVNRPSSSCEALPLHLAVWRNHPGIVARLLAAGANPDVQDGESGWSALHRALYWGHLRVAAQLLKSGAGIDVADPKGRTPLDMLSRELTPYMHGPRSLTSSSHASVNASEGDSGSQEGVAHSTWVYCWGSGANYQLGTGSTDFTLTPVRVDALTELDAVALAAAKYHSAAVGRDGRLWTWGWGRGGRLGHPDFHIHSGETALIHPWPVAGLGKRQVCSVAAGKHHMLVATTAGEVWSWGSGRNGKLGCGDVDTQPTPRRVAGLQRVRVVQVAAAHRHSAALSSAGELYTWGANGEGQLGYGTSDSACNPTPRLVDALRGKYLTSVSLAKRHSVVLTSDGEPYTWGHQLVTPRRVQLANTRDVSRAVPAGGDDQIRFHKGHTEVVRPVAVAVAAGYTHTTCVTSSGGVLYWWSADPAMRVFEVQGPLAGVKVRHVSASKTRTAVVTDQGDMYVWEAVKRDTAHRHNTTSAAEAASSDSYTGSSTTTPNPPTNRAGSESYTSLRHNNRNTNSYTNNNNTIHSIVGSSDASFTGRSYDAPAGSSYGAAGTVGLALAGSALGRAKRPQGGGGGSGAGGGFEYTAVVPVRVSGVKRVACLAVGEKHSMALSSWSVPPLPDARGFLHPDAAAVPAGGSAATGDRDTRKRGGRGGGGAIGPDGELHLDSCGSSAASSSCESSPYVARRSSGGGGAAAAGGDAAVQCLWGGVGHGASDAIDAAFALSGGGEATEGDTEDRIDSLQVICQKVVARELVEPRTTLPVLEYADAAGAALLRTFCLVAALRNLDLVLLEARDAFTALPTHLLSELEQHYRAWLQPPQSSSHHTSHPTHSHSVTSHTNDITRSGGVGANRGSTPPLGSSPIAGSWMERAAQSLPCTSPAAAFTGTSAGRMSHTDMSQRRQQHLSKLQAPRRPTSVPAWLCGATEDDNVRMDHSWLAHASHAALAAIGHSPHAQSPGAHTSAALQSQHKESSFHPNGREGAQEAEEAAARLARNVSKKLQQIAALEARARDAAMGVPGVTQLDGQQLAKLSQKAALTEALHALESGVPVDSVQALLAHAIAVAAKLAAATDTPTHTALSPSPAPNTNTQNTPANDGTTRKKSVSKSATGTPAAATPAGAGAADGKGKERERSTPSASHVGVGGGGGAAATPPSAQQATQVTSTAPRPMTQVQGWANTPTFSYPNTIAAAARSPHTDHALSLTSAGLSTSAQGSGVVGTSNNTPGTGLGANNSNTTSGAKDGNNKGAKRKGGLSMFLSGALDTAAAASPAVAGVAPTTPPPARGPAWGGAGLAAPAAVATPPVGLRSPGVADSDVATPAAAAAARTAAPAAPLLTTATAPMQSSQVQAAQGKAQGARAVPSVLAVASPAQTNPTTPATTSNASRTQGQGGAGQPGVAKSTTPATRADSGGGRPARRDGGAGGSGDVSALAAAATGVKLSLADFMAGKTRPSAPVAVAAQGAAQGGASEPAAPAWGGAVSGSSPVVGSVLGGGGRSLKDIQAEQERQRALAPPWVIRDSTSRQGGGGGSGTSTRNTDGSAVGGSILPLPGSSPPASRWYVPDPAPRPQALHHIQTEEAAMKAIAALYGKKNVSVTRIAPSHTQTQTQPTHTQAQQPK